MASTPLSVVLSNLYKEAVSKVVSSVSRYCQQGNPRGLEQMIGRAVWESMGGVGTCNIRDELSTERSRSTCVLPRVRWSLHKEDTVAS